MERLASTSCPCDNRYLEDICMLEDIGISLLVYCRLNLFSKPQETEVDVDLEWKKDHEVWTDCQADALKMQQLEEYFCEVIKDYRYDFLAAWTKCLACFEHIRSSFLLKPLQRISVALQMDTFGWRTMYPS